MSFLHKFAPKTFEEADLFACNIQAGLVRKLYTDGTLPGHPCVLFYGRGGYGKSHMANLIAYSPELVNETEGFFDFKQDKTLGTTQSMKPGFFRGWDPKWAILRLKDRGNRTKDLEEIFEHLSQASAFTDRVLVIADEISSSDPKFIEGLRGIISTLTGANIFWIFTDNNFTKLSNNHPQMFAYGQARCHLIQFDDVCRDKLKKRMGDILRAEGYNPEDLNNKHIIDDIINKKGDSPRECVSSLEVQVSLNNIK